ncbi:MAG: hypothetical protein AVDCRST_MAG95-1972 [uncultured Adhaeribacter sp.]|uniref:PNPLA domain-containing protein n=1 Tax=uncultured Adhaeribacter sp. TaxID=448109 RepID=A0A6J4IKP6_9BACT|nr:MAG: hypothetical protein AVDCRST_MAG95-1972 [uncultured Adhaeribacter sp.]
MDAVMDLTARTVSFIVVMQDALKLLTEATGNRVGNIPYNLLHTDKKTWQSLLAQSRFKDNFLERLAELVWLQDKPPEMPVDKQKICQLFTSRASSLLNWLQAPERKDYFAEHLTKNSYTVDENFYDLENKYSPRKPTLPLRLQESASLSAAPEQWRAAIQAYLCTNPAERELLAEALHYLPMLIVLAMGGGKYTPPQQRLLQEWRLPHDEADELLKYNDSFFIGNRKWRAFFQEFRSAEQDQRAAKLLTCDKSLLQVLQFDQTSWPAPDQVPLPFDIIFRAELKEIVNSREKRLQQTTNLNCHNPHQQADTMHLWALAFSGGGIRSATFNLGILQGLAKAGLLSHFDYLSTVSGGGYIGAWLTAWIQRAGSLHKVADRLNPEKSADPMGEEVRPIRWLRMFSNYLAPNASIMSADSWTMGLTWLRNTFLNQFIILLLVGSVLAMGYIFYVLWHLLTFQESNWLQVLISAVLLVGALLAGWGMHAFNRHLAPPNPVKAGYTQLLTLALMFLALLAAYFMGSWFFDDAYFKEHTTYLPFIDRIELLGPVAAVSLFGLLLVAGLGRYDSCLPPSRKFGEMFRFGFILLLSSVVATAIGAILLALVGQLLEYLAVSAHLVEKGISALKEQTIDPKEIEKKDNILTLFNGLAFTLGVPLILEVISITVVLRMALLGNAFPDERREWWGRLGALVHRLSLVWLLLAGTALLGPTLIDVFKDYGPSITAALGGWAAIVLAGVRLAFSGKTPAQPDAAKPTSKILDVLVRVTPYIFGVGILIFGSILVGIIQDYAWFEAAEIHPSSQLAPVNWPAKLKWAFASTGILLLLTWFLSRRVGVNEFSMHHFYRNRLARAYLGATRRRTERAQTANPFTNFDKFDDLKLADLISTGPTGYDGPYLIINTTLNATQATSLDRQDRKAESFVFTPLFCGFDISRIRATGSLTKKSYDYGYRPTAKYAYPDGRGPAVGTAMAISGAAANPNQGYHSSAATAFLLTLFNVRLGWWIGNPVSKKTWQSADPANGLNYVVYDLLGKSDTTKDYVCLSDGGHFDNMGLYELIRRRCRFIVLGDGEQDSLFTCDGLANAIRRCRVDFGVEIQIDVTPITNRTEKTRFSSRHYAIGKIWYSGDAPHQPSGTLLYLKSSLTGDEPADIREYALVNPAFPHQSTGDQFFNEPQFESYRRLGLHLIETALLDSQVVKIPG